MDTLEKYLPAGSPPPPSHKSPNLRISTLTNLRLVHRDLWHMNSKQHGKGWESEYDYYVPTMNRAVYHPETQDKYELQTLAMAIGSQGARSKVKGGKPSSSSATIAKSMPRCRTPARNETKDTRDDPIQHENIRPWRMLDEQLPPKPLRAIASSSSWLGLAPSVVPAVGGIRARSRSPDMIQMFIPESSGTNLRDVCHRLYGAQGTYSNGQVSNAKARVQKNNPQLAIHDV